MAKVPPERDPQFGSIAGQRRGDHRAYGSVLRTNYAKGRFWIVSYGLVICGLVAAITQLVSDPRNETDSLNQATQLWDMSRKVTSEEMKRAIKSELSSTFQKENENLQTALSVSQYPTGDLLHSSSDGRRSVDNPKMVFLFVIYVLV